MLDAVGEGTQKAVHFCFGNYGGQTIQQGSWKKLTDFLNDLHCDHLVLELAHRPASDLQALKAIDSRIKLGIGVIDIKVNHVETPEEVARRIEVAAKQLGPERIGYVHPDCGFWMLTGLWIQSHEHDDALAEIARLCKDNQWTLAHWDLDRGLHVPAPGSAAEGESINGSAAGDPLAATALGKLMHGDYSLLRVVEPASSDHADSWFEVTEQVDAALVEKTRSHLRQIADRLEQQSLSVKTWVATDWHPAGVILEHARLQRMDVISMTTRGQSGLARAFLGSVSNKVVRGASVPVLLHRPSSS